MPDKLEVFISWSGDRSKILARAIADWLPNTLQSVDCWMSDGDIAAGAQWNQELRDSLDRCKFCILCLTPENLNSNWILFEAGYLVKSITGARVAPYLLGLKPTDVPFPLAQFQAAETTKDGTRKLVSTINFALPEPLPEERCNFIFDHWWSSLDSSISRIPAAPSMPAQPQRNERAMLEELLGLVRNFGVTSAPQISISSQMLPASAELQTVENFFNERIVREDGSTLTATAIYEDYIEWSEGKDEEPLSLPTFGRALAYIGVPKAKINSRIRYIGIALRSYQSKDL